MRFSINLIIGNNNTQNINSDRNSIIDNYVLVVGGANIEYIYKQNTNIKIEIKQGYSSKSIEYGGSGLNYTLRLLTAGINVFPIFPIGNDKEGVAIIEKIEDAKVKSRITTFKYEASAFIENDIKTVESLIVTDKSSRTIWSNDSQYVSNDVFDGIIDRKLQYLESQTQNYPKIVMIGHIHSDKKGSNIDEDRLSTRKLIETFYRSGSLLYVNLGRNQLEYGFDFWKEDFEKVDVVQFNLMEIKMLFSYDNHQQISLNQMIEKFRELDVTLIITLDKLGALCVPRERRGNNQRIIYAPEINISEEYTDKTGAGDAFASGVVYYMLKEFQGKNINQMNNAAWFDALKHGRAWATYACTHLGSASRCPTETEIANYQRTMMNNESFPIDNISSMVVDLLDKAYRKCD